MLCFLAWENLDVSLRLALHYLADQLGQLALRGDEVGRVQEALGNLLLLPDSAKPARLRVFFLGLSQVAQPPSHDDPMTTSLTAALFEGGGAPGDGAVSDDVARSVRLDEPASAPSG